jgi:hypothetical protein
LYKIVPGAPLEELPIWLNPNPYYGPKDQAQDVPGREMEKKYTGENLTRFHGYAFKKAMKEARVAREDAKKTTESRENKS